MLRRTWIRCLTILVVVVVVAPICRSEVSFSPWTGSASSSIIMAITDGADPIGPLGWQAFRQVPVEQILNSAGASRGDNGPDIAWYPANGWPVVVWARNLGSDHDVAFSEWNGSEWSTVEYLTSTSADDLDPRVFVEPDGTVHVTWWTAGTTDTVFVATRAAGSSTWDAPVLVTASGESGRRPSVAVFNGVLRVAYERASTEPGANQEIVVAREQTGGGFAPEIVARTQRTARLDAVLHSERGKLWVDWKHADAEFGHATGGDVGWESPATTSWPSGSWVGVEDTRRSIRGDVLNP